MMKELKCCGKVNPLGVNKQNIRLSFTLDGSLEITHYDLQLRCASGKEVCTLGGTPDDGFIQWIDPALLQDQTA